jgi:type I restriction enzyme, S subunit
LSQENYYGRYTDPVKPESEELDDVPDTWALMTLDQISTLVTSGSRGWAEYYSDSGSYFIRAQNINSDTLNLDDVAYVSLPDGAEGERTRIKAKDLLITITGANVTKAALVKTNLESAFVNQHIALIRLVDSVCQEFIHCWIVSPDKGRSQLIESAYGNGKPGLNLLNIREVKIALPSLEEQHEIIRRVETLFAKADRIETQYHAARQHLDRLTPARLAKAFRGELVSQDPKDEPAILCQVIDFGLVNEVKIGKRFDLDRRHD